MIIRKKWCWLILIFIFWIIIFKFIPNEFYDLGGDSAQYIILSESLAKGNGFRATNFPGEPFSMQYPPVFPALLLPIVYFFGRNFYAMHLLIALFGALAILFLYKLFEKYAGWIIAFFTVLLFIFNWDFIFYASNCILSEVPYLAFSGATLLLFFHYLQKKENSRILLSCVLLATILAFFTRYIGLTLFLGVAVALFARREFRALRFVSLGFFIALIAWFSYGAFASGLGTFEHIRGFLRVDYYVPYQGSVLDHPLVIFSRFIDGANYNTETITRLLFFPLYKGFIWLEPWVSLITISAILLGFWIRLRQNKHCVFHYYFLCYLLFLMLGCYRSIGASERYIVPILPFILYYLLSFIQHTVELLAKRSKELIFFAFCCLLFYSAFLSLPASRFNYQDLPASIKNFIFLNKWMATNIEQGAIVFSRKPTVTYFYSGRKAIFYPYSFDDNLFWKQIEKNKVSYIITDEFSGETYNYLLPFIRRYRNKFTTLYRLDNGGILKVN